MILVFYDSMIPVHQSKGTSELHFFILWNKGTSFYCNKLPSLWHTIKVATLLLSTTGKTCTHIHTHAYSLTFEQSNYFLFLLNYQLHYHNRKQSHFLFGIAIYLKKYKWPNRSFCRAVFAENTRAQHSLACHPPQPVKSIWKLCTGTKETTGYGNMGKDTDAKQSYHPCRHLLWAVGSHASRSGRLTRETTWNHKATRREKLSPRDCTGLGRHSRAANKAPAKLFQTPQLRAAPRRRIAFSAAGKKLPGKSPLCLLRSAPGSSRPAWPLARGLCSVNLPISTTPRRENPAH